MEDPADIETVVEGNKIIVKGISKEKVGQYAARSERRELRNPTRAKESNMLMRLSDVKLVRLVRNNLRRV